jgi:hypothetical protein
MILNPGQIGSREKQVLAGLFLSKFDTQGLAMLGFESFTEAFNVLGFGLGGRPASIKNYRDEFDPLFPNARHGWRNRQRRQYCMKLEEDYREVSMADFANLVATFVGSTDMVVENANAEQDGGDSSSTFAKRLITGRAAEQYFQLVHSSVEDFADCEVEDTTAYGCGYDFRLWPRTGGKFKAVEVKGMAEANGAVSLTDKEHACAAALENQFYLFVVKNFKERPFHVVHANPLAGPLSFSKKVRTVVQVSWSAVA